VAKPPVSLEELAKYPTMTPWFNPGLLGKLLWRVVVSDLFGQYADRRLIVAALDPVLFDKEDRTKSEDLIKRARRFMPGEDNAEVWTFTPDRTDGSVWVDFVADLGDGFDATYAVASLLSQEELVVSGRATKRGQLLVMGGDEVYPNASEEAYRLKLLDPYGWAFPDLGTKLLRGPPIYAIPGNHDWYDGLVIFLALFARRDHLHLGGWRTHQRRSYFALQLTEKWWIWAMDAQLDDNVDQPQKEYFVAIAKGMPEGSNIILCGPEPGWLYTLKQGSKSFSVIDYIAWQAHIHAKDARIPVVLSGDTHHYSRYEGENGTTQFITSGGGGAFLHATHPLKATVNLDREFDGVSWLAGTAHQVKKLTLGTSVEEDGEPKEACYPSRAESQRMLTGNFKFFKLNPGFGFVLGALYWMLGYFVPLFDLLYLAPIFFFLGFRAYTKWQEGSSTSVNVLSAVNGLVHGCLAALLTWLLWGGITMVIGDESPRVAFWLFLAAILAIASPISGTLFGIYLYLSSRYYDLNHNDAFSSMRLDSHRNFLRIRITDDSVTIYPIGLDKVPVRDEWVLNDQKEGTPPPAYVTPNKYKPRLIETPITLNCARAT
jgi:hypothetical protein